MGYGYFGSLYFGEIKGGLPVPVVSGTPPVFAAIASSNAPIFTVQSY